LKFAVKNGPKHEELPWDWLGEVNAVDATKLEELRLTFPKSMRVTLTLSVAERLAALVKYLRDFSLGIRGAHEDAICELFKYPCPNLNQLCIKFVVSGRALSHILNMCPNVAQLYAMTNDPLTYLPSKCQTLEIDYNSMAPLPISLISWLESLNLTCETLSAESLLAIAKGSSSLNFLKISCEDFPSLADIQGEIQDMNMQQAVESCLSCHNPVRRRHINIHMKDVRIDNLGALAFLFASIGPLHTV
jgi:hypothetical protein